MPLKILFAAIGVVAVVTLGVVAVVVNQSNNTKTNNSNPET